MGRNGTWMTKTRHKRVHDWIRTYKPLLVIGGSSGNLREKLRGKDIATMTHEDMKEIRDAEDRHMMKCMQIYKEQEWNGLYYLHEKPRMAGSWTSEDMLKIRKKSSCKEMIRK